MLRINLLPPYIYEGSTRRKVYALWVVLLLAAVGGLIFWKVQLANKADEIAKMTEAEKPKQDKMKATQAKASGIVAANAALKAKADFVRSATAYNRETFQPLLGGINNYTITKVLYSSEVPSGQTVQLAAYAPSLADVGHYMMAMEKNPLITNVSVAMNSIPSFPIGEAPTAQQQIGFQGMRGAAGPGVNEDTGQSPMSAMQGSGGMQLGRGRRRGGANAGAGLGGGQQAAAGARPPGGAGHDFTVTLSLKQPVPQPPSYGGGGGGGGAQRGGGMPMGSGGAPPMMGGSGSMMGGSGGSGGGSALRGGKGGMSD